jgi:hypothetical protein
MRLDVSNTFPPSIWSFIEYLKHGFMVPLNLIWTNFVKFVGLSRPFKKIPRCSFKTPFHTTIVFKDFGFAIRIRIDLPLRIMY